MTSVTDGGSDAATTTVPAGWVTYRLDNTGGHEIHEVSFARLPDGRTHRDYVERVIPAWRTSSPAATRGS